MTRITLAEAIAASLAGWMQQLAAQKLHSEVGEDAARVELVRTVGALGSYTPKTSRLPTNWPADAKARIDVALLGRSAGASGWYGAIELKWPKTKVDVAQTRESIVQDVARAAFSTTANIRANFVVLGGTSDAISKFFDQQHNDPALEMQRKAFGALFSRDMHNPKKRLANKRLTKRFPKFGNRIPPSVLGQWKRRLATELLACSHAVVGTKTEGSVYVWQCRK